jgi:predicted phosphate transport protein (TIGR00153 family)
MRILPREEKFFQYFNQQAEIVTKVVALLRQSAAGTVSREVAAGQVAALEQEGDAVLHEVFTKLNQTFITPIDPENIHALASLLDDVLDHVEESAHRMHAYDLGGNTPPLCELTRLLGACVESLALALKALESRDSVLPHLIDINQWEEEADQVCRRAVAALFREERDPIRLLKLKEVYEVLETATDACEDVADRLQNVIVKNS